MSSRRGSSLGMPAIPEDKQPITYEQSSGRTYVVQHLRGNAVVVRRTSTGGISEGRRSSLTNQPWERRASADPAMATQTPNWASAVPTPTMPIRRGSAHLSPIQMLPPSSLQNMSAPAPAPSFRRPSYSPYARHGSVGGSVAGSICEEEEDEDAEMMDVDSPSSSAFSSPANSPPVSPGMAPSMTLGRLQPQASPQSHSPATRSPLRTKVAGWLRHV